MSTENGAARVSAWWRVPGGVLAAACLLLAAGSLAGSLLAPDAVRAGLGRFGPEGAASRYTAALHGALVPRLRLSGAGALLAALLAWRARGRAASLLAAGTRRALGELRDLAGWLRSVPRPGAGCCVLLAVTALAVGLRLPFLFQPMRFDEAVTYDRYAACPVYLLVCKYDTPNNHIFHSLCVHVACGLFGGEPWAIRLPALAAGVLLAPACYAAARALYGRRAALLSSGLVACSSALIEYSTNARGYTLVALCFVLMLGAGCLVLRRKSALGWGALGLLGAAGFWTVPVTLFPYGAVLLWLALSGLWSRETAAAYGRSFGRCLAASLLVTAGLTALAYAPVFLTAGGSAVAANRFVAPLGWGALAEALPRSLLSTWEQWHRDLPAGACWVLGGGFLTATLLHARVGGRRPCVVWVLVPWCLLVVAVRRVNPYERVWLFALPLYLMAASAGLVHLAGTIGGTRLRPLLGCAALALVGLSGWNTLQTRSVERSTETGTLPDANELASVLKGRLGPGDRVLAPCPSDAPLQYYLTRLGVPPRCLIQGVELPGWKGGRLFVVVNKAHGQTLDGIVSRYRLGAVVDTAGARRAHDCESASLFEFTGGGGASVKPKPVTRGPFSGL